MDNKNSMIERCRVAVKLRQAFRADGCDEFAEAFERACENNQTYIRRCWMESEVFELVKDWSDVPIDGRMLSFKKDLHYPHGATTTLTIALDHQFNDGFTVSINNGQTRKCIKIEGVFEYIDVCYDEPAPRLKGPYHYSSSLRDQTAGIIAAASFVVFHHMGAPKPLDRAVKVLREVGGYAFAGSSKWLLEMVRRHEMFDAKNFGFDEDNWDFIKALASETQIKHDISPLAHVLEYKYGHAHTVFSFVAALWLIEADEELAIRNKKIEEIKNDRV